MKKKFIKTSLLILAIVVTILGITKIVKYEVVAMQGNLSQANSSTGGTIAEGEQDPSSYSYNINTGTWEAIYGANQGGIAKLPGYQIYCINPGSPIKFDYQIRYADALKLVGKSYTIDCGQCAEKPNDGEKTPPVFVPVGTYDLPVAAAYIVSDEPIGEWSVEKQRAIWNLRDETIHDGKDDSYEVADGDMIVGSGTSSNSGPSIYDSEALDYAEFDSLVREQGLNPTNNTNTSDVTTKVNQKTGEYTVGPININYTNGIYGDIAFGGISEIVVIGYNSKGEVVNDNIKVDKIIMTDSATGIYGEAKTPEYFEPSGDLKVDETEQIYPKPGEDFQIVFSNPNGNISSAESDDYISSIGIKVKFKYMLANGKYTKLKGTKYEVAYSCDHSYNEHEHSWSHWTTGDSLCTHTYDHWGCKTTCYLKTYQQQWLMAADAIRTIYEEELEITLGDDNLVMDLGGNVWEDVRATKESTVDGIRADSEPAVAGIPVNLYTEDGTLVESTTTDNKGEYIFTGINPMQKYYIEFQYNGQQYENTIYTDNLSGGYSNATESTGDRDDFNAKFEEIDGDEGYSLSQVNYEDGDTDYAPDDPFEISAYTGSNGLDDKVVYPKYDQFVISDTDETIGGTKYEAIYEKGDSQKEIDFGIVQRIEFDMAIKKDVYVATVKINGKTEVYGYDKKNVGNNDGNAGDTWNISIVGGYERGIDDSDYEFTGQNGNKELLEVYVTYKIAVRNQSQSMLGHVTKLYDYYDSTYEYVPELSWQSDQNYRTNTATLDKLQDSMETGSTSTWGATIKASDDSGKLTIDIGKKQQTGETVYIYLTFKIDGEGPDLSLGNKANSTEIGSFITYYKEGTILPHYGENNYKIPNNNVIAGRVDRDSIPSSMGAKGTPKEDDEDEAPGLNVKLTGNKREMDGTVWEDERTESVNGAIIGNGLKENGEIGISGVRVQLVEKTVQGTEYVWFDTKTNSNGTYNFKGYIPGDYVVRFYYGDSKDTVATKDNDGQNNVSYNGQDYKSTTYQVGINQSATTDLDGVYKGYKNVNNQNETGTYGYDIAGSYGKNVSDAKDIYSRRESVINYSKDNVTNGKAETLALPYSGTSYTDNQLNELINNTYMVAETGVIVMEVEYNAQSNLENGNPSYSIEDIDLGLTERPKAQLEIDKSVSNIKVTLANNTVLFDVNKSATDVIWKDHTEYNLASKKQDGKYAEYYGRNNKHRYSYRDEVDKIVKRSDKGLIQLTMDEELMHGATIQITYKVKVTNAGEVDYVGTKFYYLGDSTGATQVTTIANQVVDYVANNLQFNKDNSANAGWSIIKQEELIAGGLVNGSLATQLAQFNNVIQTESLNKSLKPGESTEKTLVLTQLISTENTSDDLTYENIVEIVKTSNTVGRRMAYSIVGNQDPTASEAAEVDASVAEKVIILPPFGNTHIAYILGGVIGIILIGGIVFIIKKVLKK